MTSELRPAVEVWDVDILDLAAPDRLRNWLPEDGQSWGQHERDVSEVLGILEDIAERESARAEQAAELANFKALAETLAGALEPFAVEWDKREFLAERHWSFYSGASKALTSYKEQRDASRVA